MADKYKLKTLEDFLNIPENRIDVCLVEFKEYLNFMRPLKGLVELKSYTWIDDNKDSLTINFEVVDELEKAQEVANNKNIDEVINGM